MNDTSLPDLWVCEADLRFGRIDGSTPAWQTPGNGATRYVPAARIAALEAEKKRALDALAILGVPRGRARSVSNGIEVLSARFRKADMAQSATLAALEAELAAERERNSNNIAGAALELAAERDKVFVLTHALRAECNLHGDFCRCEHCKLVFAATPPSTPR